MATFDKYCIRAESASVSKRHGRMDAVSASFVAGRTYYPASVWVAADDNRFTEQRRVADLFNRGEKGVHVNV